MLNYSKIDPLLLVANMYIYQLNSLTTFYIYHQGVINSLLAAQSRAGCPLLVIILISSACFMTGLVIGLSVGGGILCIALIVIGLFCAYQHRQTLDKYYTGYCPW